MALVIEWSDEAKFNLKSILEYLKYRWSDKEVRKFTKQLERYLLIVADKPHIFKRSSRLEGTHECTISKHNSIYYTFDKEVVYIALIWDNRQNPDKLNKYHKTL